MPILIFYDRKSLYDRRLVPFLFFISVLGTLGFIMYMFSQVGPLFPTDESVFDMYAAHLFLNGQNPYNPSLMANSFTFYHFQFVAFSPITPLTTGGYVDTMTYPALSFLIFVPAVLLKLKASLVMLPVLLAPVAIAWYRAWSRKEWLKSSYILLPFLTLLVYLYQGASADTDALWASLLMLSYLVLPRSKMSGVFFGLGLSVKQFPIVVAPFLLYFIYREQGARKALTWFLAGAVTFLAINGYFILPLDNGFQQCLQMSSLL